MAFPNLKQSEAQISTPTFSIDETNLSKEGKDIAKAVVAALQPKLSNIQETQDLHTKVLEKIQQDIRGINRVLSDNKLIIDDPDN